MSIEEVIFKIKQKIAVCNNKVETAEKPLDRCFAKRQAEILEEVLEEIGG